MSTFLDLQNGFYNAFSQGLGFAPGAPFQMVQPSNPIVSGSDQDSQLWEYFNNIPPYSLTQNYIVGSGSQFTSNYQGMLSALTSNAGANFTKDVGKKCADKWWSYVSALTPAVSNQQLSSLFRTWAPRNGFMSVASKGAADLAQIVLDPVGAAQASNAAYKPAGVNSPTWSHNYSVLVAQLSSAPSAAFHVDSSTMNSKVSKSWTQGSNEGLFGLWGGSSSSSSQNSEFAASGVTLDASFDHVLQFVAVPGDWYNSSAMGVAFSCETGDPWVPSSPINWANTFGSPNGNMQRFAASLVVVSGMKVTVTSVATFSQADQTTINNNSGAGLWPFYIKNSASGASTLVTFNNNGNMTVTITSQAGVPIVVGVTVETVEQFVGHSAPALVL